MEDNLNQDEEYDNQARLDALRSEAAMSDSKPQQTTVGSVAKDTAVNAVKSVASKKIIRYILPVIGIFFLVVIIFSAIISIGCATIPLSGLFSETCKDLNMTSEEKKEIKSTYGIDNIANDICSQSGGVYDSKGNDCGKGY